MNRRKRILYSRKQQSTLRIEKLCSAVSKAKEIKADPNLCIYATGSFGRLEASKYSDLDLFFIHLGSEDKNKVSKVNKTLVDAAIIRTARDLKFPPFSGGGEYLDIHYLDDILESLGSRTDDSKNFFTARLLLLLESKCISNAQIYDKAIDRIIESYFRDYHDHERDFYPIFLVNDILRFWRTLCLNYEHNRDRRPPQDVRLSKRELTDRKRKSYVKNLKLKYSRLLTCYSAIAALLAHTGAVRKSDVKKIVQLTPIERLEVIQTNRADLGDLVGKLKHEYEWFLEITNKDQKELLSWIGNAKNRNTAFRRARGFGDLMFELVVNAANNEHKLRYLVI